jgi:hypothetical protein
MSRYVVKQGNIFHFRRRVPAEIVHRLGTREIYRSLSTVVAREAQRRAALMMHATEIVFLMAEDPSLTDEQIRAAAAYWFRVYGNDKRSFIDSMTPGDLETRRATLAHDLVRWTPERMERHERFDERPSMAELADADDALIAAGYPRSSGSWSGEAVERMMQAMQDSVEAYVSKRWSAYVAAPTSSPLLSQVLEEMASVVKRAMKKSEKTTDYVTSQDYKSYNLFLYFCGDKQLHKYKKTDARLFKRKLAQMPSNHGKGNEKDPHASIEIAERDNLERISVKTIKRHFSAMSSLWKKYIEEELIVENIFVEMGFKSGKEDTSRNPWSANDLNALFTSSDWKNFAPLSAGHWLPLVALFSGMRVEEIASLETADGIGSRIKFTIST